MFINTLFILFVIENISYSSCMCNFLSSAVKTQTPTSPGNDNITTTTNTNHPRAISQKSDAEANTGQSQPSNKKLGTNQTTSTSTSLILHYSHVNRVLSFFTNTWNFSLPEFAWFYFLHRGRKFDNYISERYYIDMVPGHGY